MYFQNILMLFNVLNACRAWTSQWTGTGCGWCHHSSDCAFQTQLHLIGQCFILIDSYKWLLQSSSKWSSFGNVVDKNSTYQQRHSMHLLGWNPCSLYLDFIVNSVHQRHLQETFVLLSCTAIVVGVILVDFFFMQTVYLFILLCIHSILFNVL